MGVVTELTTSWHQDAFERLEKIISAPEKFAAPDTALQSELRYLVKVVYDHADDLNQYGPLPELIVDGLDAEQIWEEMELRTEPLLDRVQQCLADYQAAAERSHVQTDTVDLSSDEHSERSAEDEDESEADDQMLSNNDQEDQSIDCEEDVDDELPLDDDDDVSDERSANTTSKKRSRDDLEDDFFDMDDMEGFADQMEMDDEAEDRDETGSDDNDEEEEEPVDLIHDIDGATDAQYDDMFNDANRSSKSAATSAENDDDEFAGLSEFKKRQLKLKKEIEQLEERNLNGRSWELMGEAKVADRPADSLIDANLDFEMADKQPSLITQEVTNDLEDLIRQRIKDKAFDDVERKAEPVQKAFRARSELETDKSEIGLAELYEKEYVEKATGVAEVEQELSKEHKEIASLFASLCYKLDALSNFHFTPKPAREEVVVRKNVPAIAMEEALPMAVSSAQAVAPEEVYKPGKHEPVADTELSRDEKKARRRSKKEKTRKEREQKAANDDIRAKYDAKFKAKRDKKAALQEIKTNTKIRSATDGPDSTEYTKSGTFFKKIQEAELQRGKEKPISTKPTTSMNSSSFKL